MAVGYYSGSFDGGSFVDDLGDVISPGWSKKLVVFHDGR